MFKDETASLPKYSLVMAHIREQIAAGVWKPGDAIPSERELSEQFGISRMTVRQALNRLTQEGVLRREQGRGTFVATPKFRQYLSRLTGFTEDMQQRGLRGQAQVLRLVQMQPPVQAEKALQLSSGRQVVLLERLRFAGKEPIALETCYLSFSGVEALLQIDFSRQSLYHVLSRQFQVIPSRAEQQVEAALCTPREQHLLQIRAGAPILRNRRITFDQHNRPFEYTESAYRGDRYVFYVELTTR